MSLAIALLLALACGLTTVAPVHAKPTEADARRLFEAADVGRLAGDIATALEAELEAGLDALPPRGREAQGVATASALSSERLVAVAMATFAAHYRADTGIEALSWFASETGRRLIEMERLAGGAEWERALSRYIDEMVQAPVASKARLESLRAYAEATGGVEDAARIQARIEQIAAELRAALPDSPERRTASEIKKASEVRRRQVAAALRTQLLVVMQFIYRDASDAELAAQARFARSEAGLWFFGVYRLVGEVLLEDIRRQLLGVVAPGTPKPM